MIYLKLFLTFLEIGAFSFGGGYGMIAVIKESVVQNGWLTESEFLNFVAVSESTPGPLAVNMATFVGSSQAGFLGALLSTVGVILPSFLIILLIVIVMKNLLKLAGVNAALTGIRPAIIGLITATAITMIMSTIFGFVSYTNITTIDYKGIIIFVILGLVTIYSKKIEKRKVSPIILILLSAVLGIIFYS